MMATEQVIDFDQPTTPTRSTLAALITDATYLAKREMAVVSRFTTDQPNQHELLHREIDRLLTQWQNAT